MREADYEPEEGEIQDDDEGVDGSQPVSEDTGLGKNKRAHVSSYSHHSSRGDTLHHRLLDPNMHAGERLRAAIMDWVAPSKSNSARSSRFRESTTQSRYPHSRHCIKEWSNMKSLGRNSLRETHTRETHGTSKAWCPTYCSKLHERNSTSNYADSGNNGQEPSSTRWSHYSKSVKGLDSKKKPTCDKSTNTMERRQKNFSHSRMCSSSSKQNNSKKDQKSKSEAKVQVPESVETNDEETVKESLPVHSPAKSDCSDVVEIINVPRKEPEVITIEDSDEEVDKTSRLGDSEAENETNITEAPLENDSQTETVDIPHSLHTEPVLCENINVNNQNIDISKSRYNETNDSARSPHMSNIWDPVCTVEVIDKENDVSLPLSVDQCNVSDDPILESPRGLDAQDIQCNDSNIITSTIASSDQILEEVNQLAIPETHKDTLESPTSDLHIAPTLEDSVQVDNREIISVNSTTHSSVNDFTADINETSVTRVSFNKNFDIFSKENPLQYVSYWGNSTQGNRDSMQNNKITSLSLGQVLTNRFYSDSPYIRQSQYATVYFDRVGTNNGKSKSYDGQKYRFSVKVPEFIINIGRDSDSGDDSDSKSVADSKTDDTPSEQLTPNKNITSPPIPVDFEKKLDVLLKQARYQQEEKTQSVKDNIKANSNMESSLSAEESINPCGIVSSTTSTSKKSSDSGNCARVLPSSKDITSSRVGKAKSKISFLRNSYSNLTSDKYNGNGLYVKAAKKLVLDLNKQLVQYRNRKFLSRSKVINQTSSMPTGVNISLLSPNKQREYIKLQRKIIQLTRRSKEEQSEGKTKVVTCTKSTVKENKADEAKKNKVVVRSFTVRNTKISSKEPHGNVTFSPTESESSTPRAINEGHPSLTDANDMVSDPGASRICNKISKSIKDNTNDDPTVNNNVTQIQNNSSENNFSCGEPTKNTDLTGNPRSEVQEMSSPAQKHERSVPTKKHQSSPCKKQESTLAKKHESVPTKKHESVPTKKHESVSAKKQESTPCKKNGSTPSKKYENSPSKKHENALPKKQESVPTKKHESALAKKQESAPTKKHESALAKKQESAPTKKHESASAKKHERSVSSENRHTSTKRQCIENIQNVEHSGELTGNSGISMKGKPSEQLWSTETKLIAKRREVLENISSVRLNLHKIEAVNFKRKQLVEEMQKLKEQLKQAELHLMQKENYLNMLNIRVEEAKQNNQRCQSELLSLSLECEEIGCKVDGPNYNIPNTCADLIRNEMAAMSEAIQLLEIQKSTMNTTGTEFIQQA